jgi:hypothetical protein
MNADHLHELHVVRARRVGVYPPVNVPTGAKTPYVILVYRWQSHAHAEALTSWER